MSILKTPHVITVKFLPAKGKQPARMRAYSEMIPRGVTVKHAERNLYDSSNHYESARYAAIKLADKMTTIDNPCHVAPYFWEVLDIFQSYNGDRIVTLGQVRIEKRFNKRQFSGMNPLFTRNNAFLCRNTRYVGGDEQWICNCDDPLLCEGVKRAKRS